MIRGSEQPLFIQLIDHRESFQTKLYGPCMSFRRQASSRMCGRSEGGIAGRTALRWWQPGGGETVGCIVLGRGEDERNLVRLSSESPSPYPAEILYLDV